MWDYGMPSIFDSSFTQIGGGYNPNTGTISGQVIFGGGGYGGGTNVYGTPWYGQGQIDPRTGQVIIGGGTGYPPGTLFGMDQNTLLLLGAIVLVAILALR